MAIRVANAPCSWGALEFDCDGPAAVSYPQVLDEIAATGYEGTELGDWGFMPTDPDVLARELRLRRLALVAAFVPIAFANPSAVEAGEARAVRVGRLLHDVAGEAAIVVLADDNCRVPDRTRLAGRIRAEHGLRPEQWTVFAQAVARVARTVRDATGLRSVFHPHCGGWVETTAEIDVLMSRTDPALVGLCLDTGHLMYGGGDPLTAIAAYGDRIWHVHVKDCDPRVAAAAREREWDYHRAVREGIFCELGRGAVPFLEVRDALSARGYAGWIVVEQDVLPGVGTPAASAQRNREYLRQLGL
jgi:inosose dehydratase